MHMVGSADETVQNSFLQTWQQLWKIIYKYYVLKQIDYSHARVSRDVSRTVNVQFLKLTLFIRLTALGAY